MKNKFSPQIRFQNFSTSWDQYRAEDIFSSVSEKNHSNLPILSASQESGMVYRDKIGIDIKYDEKSTGNYKRVLPGQFVIHLRSFQGGFAYSEIEGITSPAYTIIDFKNKEQSYPLFWKDFFTSDRFIKRLETVTYGIRDGRSISFKDFSILNFVVPSYKEQKTIGVFLGKLNKAITLNQLELTTLKQTKQGFLQKMFPKEGETVPEIRFPGFREEWIDISLGEIMEVTSVKRIHQSDWTNSGVRFLRARDIVAEFKNENPADYLFISNDKYNEYTRTSGKVSPGDLLVTGVGSIGIPMLITNNEPLYFKDGNVIWFKNAQKLDGDFFYYSFCNMEIQKYIQSVAGIGTVGTYTIESGKRTPISIPSRKEQIKIGNFFSHLENIIVMYQKELDILKQTKKAFLQKMFI